MWNQLWTILPWCYSELPSHNVLVILFLVRQFWITIIKMTFQKHCTCVIVTHIAPNIFFTEGIKWGQLKEQHLAQHYCFTTAQKVRLKVRFLTLLHAKNDIVKAIPKFHEILIFLCTINLSKCLFSFKFCNHALQPL